MWHKTCIIQWAVRIIALYNMMFTVKHTNIFLYMFALWCLVKFFLEIFISLRAVVFIVLWIHLKVKHCQFKHWLKWWMTICKKCLLLDLPFRAMHKSFHLLYFWYQNLRFDLKINPSFMNTLCIKILLVFFCSYTVVHRTEVVMKTLNPTWRPFMITARSLCNGDYDR